MHIHTYASTSSSKRDTPRKTRPQNKDYWPRLTKSVHRTIGSFRAPPLQMRLSRTREPGRCNSRRSCTAHVHVCISLTCPYMSLRVRGTPSSNLSREACFRNRSIDHAHLPLPFFPFPKRTSSLSIGLTLYLHSESDIPS